MSFKQFLKKQAEAAALVVDDSQLSSFDRYYELLVEWNTRMNLTAITEPEDVALKHMIDSLTCLDPEVFPTGVTMIDVGTGAGFPGLPLKIHRPDIQLTLLDSLQKRLNFLAAVIDEVGLKDVSLVHHRAEDGARDKKLREQFQVAISRAVARLPVLAELCLPFVKRGGFFVALKGAQYKEELAEAQYAIGLLGGRVECVRPVSLPGLEDVRAVIYIKKIADTDSSYPRRAGLPEKKPLTGQRKLEHGAE